MKKYQVLLISVALVAVMFAGCTSPAPTSTTIPSITQTSRIAPSITATIAQVQDPIIGVWRYRNMDADYDNRYRFNANGTYAESFLISTAEKKAIFSRGTWSAQGGNSYVLHETDGNSTSFIYVPAKKAIYETGYPLEFLTRYQGDVMAGGTL